MAHGPVLLVLTLALISGQSPSPSPAAPGDVTPADYKSYDKARLDALLDAYPKFEGWVRETGEKGKEMSDQFAQQGAAAAPALAAYAAQAGDPKVVEKTIGMPLERFNRDLTMTMLAYGQGVAEETLKQTEATLKALQDNPAIPAEQRQQVADQMAAARQSAATLPGGQRVPDAAVKLVLDQRARLEKVLLKKSEEAPPAAEPSPADETR